MFTGDNDPEKEIQRKRSREREVAVRREFVSHTEVLISTAQSI